MATLNFILKQNLLKKINFFDQIFQVNIKKNLNFKFTIF